MKCVALSEILLKYEVKAKSSFTSMIFQSISFITSLN